jgi:predicted O-methyltransferase YrrM
MIGIRPHHLFNLVNEASYEERMVKIVLPDQHAPILLETAILLALARLVDPRKFFEFGTYLGVETLNMAANLSEASHVYTLDLDEESFRSLRQDVHDRPLTLTHFDNLDKLAFLGTSYERRITQLKGESKTYDFSPFDKQIDMVYVDGGHDLPTLISDTRNALRMLSDNHAACVAWHDYETQKYPQVTDHLLELSVSIPLFHVQESRIAFLIQNDESLVAALKQGSTGDREQR